MVDVNDTIVADIIFENPSYTTLSDVLNDENVVGMRVEKLETATAQFTAGYVLDRILDKVEIFDPWFVETFAIVA